MRRPDYIWKYILRQHFDCFIAAIHQSHILDLARVTYKQIKQLCPVRISIVGYILCNSKEPLL